MKKNKFYLMILILISILIVPSTSAFAQSNNQVYLPLVNRSEETTKTIAPQIPIPPTPTPDYYVSPSGNDSNSGTQAKPWKTIKKAADTLVAGNTVKILPGTYYEKLTPKNSGTSNAYIFYTADPGTVVLSGSGVGMSSVYTDGLVLIQGNSYIKVENLTLKDSTANGVYISQNSSGKRPANIVINFMTIQNTTRAGIQARSSDNLLLVNNTINKVLYSSGIGVWWSNNVVVHNNNILNAHYYHECQGAHEEALTISGTTNFEVSYNTLDNTPDRPAGFCDTYKEKLGIDVKESSENGLVHHNTVRNMNAAGIYVDAWKAGSNGTPTLNHIDIYNNYVSDGGGIVVGTEQSEGVVEYINIYNNLVVNAWFAGIQVRGAWGDGLRKNITIYNNTIYGASPAGGHGGAGIYVTTNNLGSNNGDKPVIIRNNISMFYFLSTGGGTVGQIRAGDSTMASKIDASNNIVYGPQSCSTEFPSCVEVGNRITAPSANVFINPGAFDLKLKSGSAAIDKGYTIGMMNTDFDGTLRPSGPAYDIGAYEFK